MEQEINKTSDSGPRGQVLGKLLLVLGLISLVQAALAVFISLDQLDLISNLGQGKVYAESYIEKSDTLQQYSEISSLVLYVAFFVLFLVWFRQVFLNLELLRFKPRTGRGWVIWGFFVPVINFFRPYQVCRDIVDGSNPGQECWLSCLVPVVWWIMFWVARIAVFLQDALTPVEGAEFEAYVNYARSVLANDLASLVLYLIFLAMIGMVRGYQQQKFVGLKLGAATAPVPAGLSCPGA